MAQNPAPESAPAPGPAPWLLVKGRVLDFALVNLDDDSADELLLLFSGRLELWRKEDAGWRFAQVVSLGSPQKTPRAAAQGRLSVCPFGPGGAPMIYPASADLGETTVFIYNGHGLKAIDKTPGAVLACGANGPLHARYESASTRFAPALLDDAERPVAQAPSPFLSVIWNAAQPLFLLPDGRLTTPSAELKSLRCGLNPQRLDDGRLLCSLPLIEPASDGVQLFSVQANDAPPAVTTVLAATPGAIWSLRVWKEMPTAKEELLVLRYFSERDESQLTRHAL